MGAFTTSQAEAFKIKASGETYFTKFVHYNQYLEVTYVVPQSEFKGLRVPQWVHISSIVPFEDSFIIIIGIFNDDRLYDIDIALKHVHKLIDFKK